MTRVFWVMAFVVGGLLYSTNADAYIGPGSGISAFGSLLAILGTVVFTLLGFVWYPFKRLIKLLRKKIDDRSA